MRCKKLYATVLVMVLSVFLLAGCDKQKVTRKEQADTTEVLDGQPETETMADSQLADAEEVTNYPKITSDKKLKDYQSVVTIGDCGFEMYTYLDPVAKNYAKSINKVADNLKGKADVYNMVIPLGSEIVFPDNRKGEVKSGNQREAMLQIQAKMNKNVKQVDIYDALMSHRNEYVYFRTDHHWTTRGAYYAYEQFCAVKGIEPETLDSYESKDFEGFLGSFYSDTENKQLKKNPDVLTAYYPHAESICHVTPADGDEYDWPVIYDVSNYSAGLKYSTFIASDNPYTEIENKELDDGSSCIVVKESFGNAFIPFLVDHYQTVYVIDYRYWTGSISELAEEKGATDVLFLNNLSMIRNKSLVGKLYRVV